MSTVDSFLVAAAHARIGIHKERGANLQMFVFNLRTAGTFYVEATPQRIRETVELAREHGIDLCTYVAASNELRDRDVYWFDPEIMRGVSLSKWLADNPPVEVGAYLRAAE